MDRPVEALDRGEEPDATGDRRNALDRKVTGDELARPELTHHRLLVGTPSLGERTARAKTAAGRWRIRRGWLARDDDFYQLRVGIR